MSEASEIHATNPEGHALEKALKTAQRTETAKRYGLMALGVVGQVLLGAAGAAIVLKIRDRKAANDNAGNDQNAARHA